jgi:hypothetical protein
MPYDPNTELYKLAKKRVARLRDFYITVFIFVVVNIFSYATDYFTNGEITWAYWVTFGFGIGLLFHAAGVLSESNNWFRNWESRKIKEFIDSEIKIQEFNSQVKKSKEN